MLTLLKNYNRLNITVLLLCFSLLSLFISLLRVYLTNSGLFLFLNWNLFLAFVPWFFTSLIIIKPHLQKRRVLIIGLLLLWIIFFPNALYIVTDLFHLRVHSLMPVWFDLVLIMAFAWTGLLFGFVSLFDLEQILSQYTSRKIISTVSTILLFITSFGIYIGRYLRWNSWDILLSPLSMFNDISTRIIDPFAHPGTWGMTLLLGILLNMFYWSLKLLKLER